MPKKSKKKASFIPDGFKPPNFIPAGFKPPAPAPAPARKSGYSCDYSRFDDVCADEECDARELAGTLAQARGRHAVGRRCAIGLAASASATAADGGEREAGGDDAGD